MSDWLLGIAEDYARLRDYFAAAALTGLLAGHADTTKLPTGDEAAEWAYEYADAMIAERAKAK